MKIKIKKIESIIKILILSCFLFAPSISLADLSTEKWEKVCDSANNNCVIAIQIQIKLPNSDVLETFSTALVRVGKNPKNEKVPVLFIRLPLNTDLKTKPKAEVGKEVFLNLDYAFCNTKEGYVTSNAFNEKGLNLLKMGKELFITYADNSLKKNIRFKFPLKGFTKAYNSLTE